MRGSIPQFLTTVGLKGFSLYLSHREKKNSEKGKGGLHNGCVVDRKVGGEAIFNGGKKV
jgi:hypothetical protein